MSDVQLIFKTLLRKPENLSLVAEKENIQMHLDYMFFLPYIKI